MPCAISNELIECKNLIKFWIQEFQIIFMKSNGNLVPMQITTPQENILYLYHNFPP